MGDLSRCVFSYLSYHYSVGFTLDVYGHEVTDDMKGDDADKFNGVLKGAV